MKEKNIYIIIFLILLSCFSGCLSNHNTTSETISNKNTPIPTVLPFEQQPVNEETVKVALRSMDVKKFILASRFEDPTNAFSFKIGEVEVKDDISNGQNNQKIVRIRYLNDVVWDAHHFMQMSSIEDLAIIYNLFKNQNINTLILETEINFTDRYGNEYQDVGLTITFNKETAHKINYDNLEIDVTIDYRKLLSIAESYKINPAVEKSLLNEK